MAIFHCHYFSAVVAVVDTASTTTTSSFPSYTTPFQSLSNLITFHIKWDSTLPLFCYYWSSANESKTVLQFKASKTTEFMQAHNLSSWLAEFTFVWCLFFFTLVCHANTDACLVCTLPVIGALMPHKNPNVKSNNKTKQNNSISASVAHTYCNFISVWFYCC